MKALELENVHKAYQVVKRLPQKTGSYPLAMRSLTRFFLGETFSVLGTRTVTSITALDGLSFSVEPGQVVGVFGKNGSGKTTMLSILGGIFPQDSGEVRCFGHDLRTELRTVRQWVIPIFGWLNAITRAFTGRQNIEKFLIMHHVDPGPLAAQIDALAAEIDVADRLDDRAARYSQGMLVKLQAIAALLLYQVHGRSLLLLDEPFLGLDLFSQRYLRDFVKHKMRHDNFSMILATHQPEDIEEICDEVIVLDQGKIIAKDSVAELRRQVQTAETIQLEYLPPGNQPLAAEFFQRDGVLKQQTSQQHNQVSLSLLVEDSRSALAWLVSDLVQADCRLVSLHTRTMRFDDVLVQLIERQRESHASMVE